MTNHHGANIDRMREAADAYLADAELLSSATNKSSDADHLLQLLAFEILLKAVRLVYNPEPERSHSYRVIFESLPADVQERVLERARARIGQAAGYSNVFTLLGTFEKNFVKLRYSYESYERLNEAEYAAVGATWIAGGAKTEDARFRYYPEELLGLTEALRSEISP